MQFKNIVYSDNNNKHLVNHHWQFNLGIVVIHV